PEAHRAPCRRGVDTRAGRHRVFLLTLLLLPLSSWDRDRHVPRFRLMPSLALAGIVRADDSYVAGGPRDLSVRLYLPPLWLDYVGRELHLEDPLDVARSGRFRRVERHHDIRPAGAGNYRAITARQWQGLAGGVAHGGALDVAKHGNRRRSHVVDR